MGPEVRLLRYFLAVADELNFTRAAEKLHVAQPALSAQIRQLESRLGTQLLERTTRAVRLTDAGAALQAHGPAALAALEHAWDAARRVGRGEAGRLRIAYSASAGYETAPCLVQALDDHYPDIDVTTELCPTPDIAQAVLDGRSDVGLARMAPSAKGLRLRTVRLERQGVLVCADHPLSAHSEVDLAAVSKYPIVMHSRSANPAHYDWVVDLFHRAGVEPRLVKPVVAFDARQHAIREGRAIGLVGVSSVVSLAERLRWVALVDPAPRVASHLVLREGVLSPVAECFERVALAIAATSGWLHAPAGI